MAPPTVRESQAVVVPKGAAADAIVELEVVVGADGVVREARVVSGPPELEGAALDAMRGFVFEPARRGGVPVVARIRYRLEVRAPAPDASPPRIVPRLAPASRVENVVVLGARDPPGGTKLDAVTASRVPGTFGDPFRAIESLPGVSPIASGLPFFFVRGAPPGNVGYLLDEIPVPLLFHLGFGPSVVGPWLVDRVDFYPGAAPAAYGRYAGGVVAGATRDPLDVAHGEANLRLFDAGAMVETPFADGRGHALVGGRYSFTGPLLGLAAPNTKLAYWDYQARLAWDLSPRDRVSLFAFGSYDELDDRDDSSKPFSPEFDTQFHRLDLRYDRALTTGHLRIAATLGLDSTLFDGNDTDLGHDTERVRERSAMVRIAYDTKLSESVRFRAGADAGLQHYDIVTETVASTTTSGEPPSATATSGTTRAYDAAVGLTVADIYPPRTEGTFGARADLVWTPTDAVEIVFGLRSDFYVSHDGPLLSALGRLDVSLDDRTVVRPAFDPRLSVNVALTPKLSWTSTFGVGHQPPNFFVPIPGIRPGSFGGALQTSIQLSEGFDVRLPAGFDASLTGFSNRFLDLVDAAATCRRLDEIAQISADCATDRTRGRAYGVELMVRRKLSKRIAGWVSYTLSRSTRTEQTTSGAQLLPQLAAGEFPAEFDRTHVLNAVLAVDVGSGVRAGVRYFYYSGRPYSQQYEGFPIPPYDSQRMPGFSRIDLRAEKTWTFGGQRRIAIVLEGLNVLLQKEVIEMRCIHLPQASRISSYTTPTPDPCTPREIGPISVPSLGLEGAF